MSEQPQPTPSATESEVQTEPTLFEKVIAGTERIAKDATQYVAGLTEGDTPPEGTTVTEHDLRMRKAGKELAGEFNKAAVQGVVYVAGCADAVSKSLHAQYTEPAASEEKVDEGLTFNKIMEVTIKSLAETADALSFTMRETEKNLTKCKNPNCTCAKCACAEGSCQCGTETKLSACKNANCTCATCECAEGTCQCGTAKSVDAEAVSEDTTKGTDCGCEK